MFVRKLYYDLATGVVLSSHMRQGSVKMTTFGEDTNVLPELAGRTEADTGCIVWTEPDPQVEANFSAATSVTVDVETKQPVFDFTPIPVEPDPMEVMENALNELGVETRE